MAAALRRAVQVLYDKSRMLQPILRARSPWPMVLAEPPTIRRWARQPDDPKFARPALAELGRLPAQVSGPELLLSPPKGAAAILPTTPPTLPVVNSATCQRPQAPKDAWSLRPDPPGAGSSTSTSTPTPSWASPQDRRCPRTTARPSGVPAPGSELTAFLRDVVEPDVEGITGLSRDRSIYHLLPAAPATRPPHQLCS